MRSERIEEPADNRFTLGPFFLYAGMSRCPIGERRAGCVDQARSDLSFPQSSLCLAALLAALLDLGFRATAAFRSRGGKSVVNDS